MAVCPSCGKNNPEGFKFCGFCTASLDQAAVAVTEERKVISVLLSAARWKSSSATR